MKDKFWWNISQVNIFQLATSFLLILICLFANKNIYLSSTIIIIAPVYGHTMYILIRNNILTRLHKCKSGTVTVKVLSNIYFKILNANMIFSGDKEVTWHDNNGKSLNVNITLIVDLCLFVIWYNSLLDCIARFHDFN